MAGCYPSPGKGWGCPCPSCALPAPQPPALVGFRDGCPSWQYCSNWYCNCFGVNSDDKWVSEAKPFEHHRAEGLNVKEMVKGIQGCSLPTDLQDVGCKAWCNVAFVPTVLRKQKGQLGTWTVLLGLLSCEQSPFGKKKTLFGWRREQS